MPDYSHRPAAVSQSGIAYHFGQNLWCGQQTSYRTGDEGWLYADGWFDYTKPVYPVNVPKLENFTTLDALTPNMFGGTSRFTARDGTAAATSGNRIIRDHFTGLEWYVLNTLTAIVWNTAIDNAEAFNDGTYADWHIPPTKALVTLVDLHITATTNYSPFSVTSNIWTGSTAPSATTNALILAVASGSVSLSGKTSANGVSLYCRRFI